MSLRRKVFDFLDSNDVSNVKGVYRAFRENAQTTLKQYYHMWKRENNGYLPSIELSDFDTEKEMVYAIQQIKDPVRRAENIARLHNMRLKPLVNKKQLSLKEMFDAS